MSKRQRLAVLGGFFRIPQSAPHGTNHAGTTISHAIARSGRFEAIDLFVDRASQRLSSSEIELPPGVRAFERRELALRKGEYQAIYAVGGDVVAYLPHTLRPIDDWTQVVCEIDMTHHHAQWTNLFMAAVTGQLRPTDGFVFKSNASARAFLSVWQQARAHLGVPFCEPRSLVSLNPIDLDANRHSEALRADTRRELGLTAGDAVFLAFSRLEPFNKGDPRALIVLWRQLIHMQPNATLVLAGASNDPTFPPELEAAARQAGVSDRVIVLPDPYERWPNARNRLMSAADAFLHLTTGLEEACPLTVLEAMAHGLPPIVSQWSGLPEVVKHDENGWVIPTWRGVVPASVAQLYAGCEHTTFNRAVSGLITCDWRRLLDTLIAVAGNVSLRKRVGESAAQAVRQAHAIADRARERIDFAVRLAGQAEQAWALGPVDVKPPLVDANALLDVLSGLPIDAGQHLLLGNAGNVAFLPNLSAQHRAAADTVIRSLRERASTSIGDLMETLNLPGNLPVLGDLAAGGRLGSEPTRAFQEFLFKLLRYGVVELAAAPESAGPNGRAAINR